MRGSRTCWRRQSSSTYEFGPRDPGLGIRDSGLPAYFSSGQICVPGSTRPANTAWIE